MTFLIFSVLVCIAIGIWQDVRELRRTRRDVQLYIAGDATDERVDWIAERIAGAIRR